jgi:hypothetical protein
VKRGLARLVWWSAREGPKVIERPLARVEAATLGRALRALGELFPVGMEVARLRREAERMREEFRDFERRSARVHKRMAKVQRNIEQTNRLIKATVEQNVQLSARYKAAQDEAAALRLHALLPRKKAIQC